MDLIYNQQVAQEGGRTHVAVLDLKSGEQDLIHGPHHQLASEIALGVLRRPAPILLCSPLRITPTSTPDPGTVSILRFSVSGHRQDNRWSLRSEGRFGKPLHASMDLHGSSTRGQTEVKPVDQPGPIESQKPSQRHLGLPGAGFCLQYPQTSLRPWERLIQRL